MVLVGSSGLDDVVFFRRVSWFPPTASDFLDLTSTVRPFFRAQLTAAVFKKGSALGTPNRLGSAAEALQIRSGSSCSLAVLLLDVAGNVHEEGDGQKEGLHNVGDIEVSAGVNLGPLGVVVVEPWATKRRKTSVLHLYPCPNF